MNKAKILNEKREKAYAARLKQLEQFRFNKTKRTKNTTLITLKLNLA